jgi:hypothetical protein
MRHATVWLLVLILLAAPLAIGCGGDGGAKATGKKVESVESTKFAPPPGFNPGGKAPQPK